jgi:hypothetical protein
MKKIILLLTCLLVVLSAGAEISVCNVEPDANGHFNCPYIKSGTITWDAATKTLTLNNAVVEYIYEPPYDYVYPIRITEDATIVIKGECKLTTTGYIAIGLEGTNSKNVTIQGDGSLYLASNMRGIYLKCTRLTIKDITLQTTKGIMNNGDGVLCALSFDNVQADINGVIERIGEPITFHNCAITYPQDAYIEHEEYGYFIANGDGSRADHIIISRNGGNTPGDVNRDGEINIADVNAVIDGILSGTGDAACDVNTDGEINIADVNAVIDIIFGGGPAQNNHKYVDLGLPSGTLWATCNIGASKPEEYGDYFAWGETAPKEIYTWETYKWCNGTNDTMTKYCTDSSFGTVDGKTELLPEDDAAYVNWGTSWRMPTQEQCIELSNNCTWTWTMLNGVNGHLITGPNGNTMFLPAAGDRYNNKVGDLGSYGQFWSRTLNSSTQDTAYILFLHSYGLSGINANNRYFGFSVRAVRVP